MGDPRLNSVHLDPTRRQDFRRAREELLQARGVETLYAESAGGTEPSATFIHNAGTPPAIPDTGCWLTDREFTYPLKVGLNTLGRSSDNDLVVEELFISRRHCAVLVHHDGSCVLHDMSSKNGTYLNGKRIAAPTPLHTGDEIRICNRQFVFRTRTDPNPGHGATHTING
jgi:hypothetical protein